MIKLMLLTPSIVLMSLSSMAQNKMELSPKTSKTEVTSKVDGSTESPVFKTTATPISNTKVENQLLKELYMIQDERHRIESNGALSQSDRGQLINENNASYISKKMEFINYVNTKGILNVSKNEQNYFLSILKNDKNELEYNRNVELIKNSK